MPTLVLLVGNIGSGKSTFAKEYVKKGYICVSRDAMRVMFAAGGYIFDKNTESLIYKIERSALLFLLQEGFNVVVDETNVSPGLRARLIAVGQEYEYKVAAHVMHRTPKKESVERRMRDGSRGTSKVKWGEIWDLFNKHYVEPILKEGFNTIVIEQAEGKPLVIQKPPDSKTRRTRNDE